MGSFSDYVPVEPAEEPGTWTASPVNEPLDELRSRVWRLALDLMVVGQYRSRLVPLLSRICTSNDLAPNHQPQSLPAKIPLTHTVHMHTIYILKGLLPWD